RVDVSIANRGLERGRVPLAERVGRLHVVVAVNQDRRRAGDRFGLRVNDGMAGRFTQLGLQTQPAELSGDPLGGAADVLAMLAVAADAGNPEQVAQFALESLAILLQVLVQIRHRVLANPSRKRNRVRNVPSQSRLRPPSAAKKLASSRGVQYN